MAPADTLFENPLPVKRMALWVPHYCYGIASRLILLSLPSHMKDLDTRPWKRIPKSILIIHLVQASQLGKWSSFPPPPLSLSLSMMRNRKRLSFDTSITRGNFLSDVWLYFVTESPEKEWDPTLCKIFEGFTNGYLEETRSGTTNESFMSMAATIHISTACPDRYWRLLTNAEFYKLQVWTCSEWLLSFVLFLPCYKISKAT